MSIDRSAAREIAERYLDDYHRIFDEGSELVIVDDALESSTHWAFAYADRRWLETGDFRYALAGNGPIFVSKVDGAISLGGSSRTIEAQLADSPPGKLLRDAPPDRALPDTVRSIHRATSDYVRDDPSRDIRER